VTAVDPPEIGEKFLIDEGEGNYAELLHTTTRIVLNRKRENRGKLRDVIDISNIECFPFSNTTRHKRCSIFLDI